MSYKNVCNDLECVITCVNYGDFLAHTLPLNKQHFDRVVIVTTPEDKATQRVCEFWNVHCIQEKRITENASFYKGVGINRGLKALGKGGWTLHMDADIILPPTFRSHITHGQLNTNHIYGCDRFMVKSFEEWEEFYTCPRLQHENNIFTHIDSFPMGARVYKSEESGYIPIGFFQLWHSDSGVNEYPEQHKSAARGDMLFSLKWDRAHRSLLPEVVVYHLESQTVPMGTNWGGRQTKLFGMGVDSYSRPEGLVPPNNEELSNGA